MTTGISWTDETWNPTVGCTRVSAGCDNCYAYALHDRRHLAWKRGRWPEAPGQYRKPFSQVQLLPDRLDQPLRWRKPRRIFVDSMSDLFHEDVPGSFIIRVFEIMSMARQHTFQILTKRPGRMRELVLRGFDPPLSPWPLPNVWLGVSVEDQATADERTPLLLETPAAVRFVSYEPVLDRIDLGQYLDTSGHRPIDWIIVGGESGSHHRPMPHGWVESIREQCRAAGVAYFGKQDAGPRPGIALPGDLGDREFPQSKEAR